MFAIPIDDELRLGLLEERHAGPLFELVDANRAHLRQWLPWLDRNTTPEHTRAFIKATLEQHATGNGVTCGIFRRGELAGVIGLHYIDWANRRTSIGYWVAEAQQGQGLVTRACASLLDYVFSELGLTRAEIACATENARSCAIPERLGFTKEGVLRQREWLYDHFVDHVVYGLLASEWKGLSRR